MVKDYEAENLHLLVKLEQGTLDVSDYMQKINDCHIFGDRNFRRVCSLFVQYGSSL